MTVHSLEMENTER